MMPLLRFLNRNLVVILFTVYALAGIFGFWRIEQEKQQRCNGWRDLVTIVDDLVTDEDVLERVHRDLPPGDCR